MRTISGYPDCFACGKENPGGLQLDLVLEDGRVSTSLEIPDRLAGFPGMAHGGVIATLLDEVMAWAAIEAAGRLCVSGEMNIRFVKPIGTGVSICAWGETSEEKKRYLLCRGQIVDGEGTVLARGEGRYFPVSGERDRAMKQEWARRLHRPR